MTRSATAMRQHVLDLLATRDRAVGRALLALYRRQTEHEQRTGTTQLLNHRGFSAVHASRGTRDALYFQQHGWLPIQSLYWWRHQVNGRSRISRYADQLVEIALSRQGD